MMGDICDMNDLERFLRSPEGKERLDEIANMLKGRTISAVEFSNEIQFVATTLTLDDGSTFMISQPSLEVDVIRDEFEDVLKREYLVDYPERKKEP